MEKQYVIYVSVNSIQCPNFDQRLKLTVEVGM